MKKRKRILSLLLAVLMVAFGSVMTSVAESDGLSNFQRINDYSAGQFKDVSSGSWYAVSVSSVYEYALMIGISNTEFGPSKTLTLAEVYTIAARLHSIYYSGEENFASSSPWYKVYTEYAQMNFIGDKYNKDADMTKAAPRYKVAEILAGALPDEALNKINTVEKNQIPDVSSSAEYAASVYKLYEAGIIVGTDAYGNFSPDKSITRSEIAAITTRMVDRSLRKPVSFLVDDSFKTYSTTKETIYRFLTKNMGFTPAAACGIMGNIQQESSYNYNCTTGSAYGLFQWTGSRKTNLINYCSEHGLKYNSLEGQMRFFEYEMTRSYQTTITELNGYPNTYDSLTATTTLFEERFERAGKPLMEKRIAYAQDAWNLYGSKDK